MLICQLLSDMLNFSAVNLPDNLLFVFLLFFFESFFVYVNVMVQFYPLLNFYFSLFLYMYDNEYKTKLKKKKN